MLECLGLALQIATREEHAGCGASDTKLCHHLHLGRRLDLSALGNTRTQDRVQECGKEQVVWPAFLESGPAIFPAALRRVFLASLLPSKFLLYTALAYHLIPAVAGRTCSTSQAAAANQRLPGLEKVRGRYCTSICTKLQSYLNCHSSRISAACLKPSSPSRGAPQAPHYPDLETSRQRGFGCRASICCRHRGIGSPWSMVDGSGHGRQTDASVRRCWDGML